MPNPPRELRLVLTVPDYEAAVAFYRDALGLTEVADFSSERGRVKLFSAGRATLEIADGAQAEYIDEVEVGRRVAGPIRVGFEVADTATLTPQLATAGATVVAPPVRTPWGSLNARLDAPGGLHMTLFSAEIYVTERPRLDGSVPLADPDPTWAATAEQLLSAIRSVLGPSAVLAEHVGSTSVPGLVAKPILDLLLAVPDSSDEPAYVPRLEQLGYELHVREPEWHQHRLLKLTDPMVNLHVFTAGSAEIKRMIDFRDHLRSNAADLELYARTKSELAAQTWEYVQDYADAKADVVADILERARATVGDRDD
jgi:GrpB-like predicted nucleotidyltransferase (UPF0157 family)/predicted enzyme related to lactoylglutathione lyase